MKKAMLVLLVTATLLVSCSQAPTPTPVVVYVEVTATPAPTAVPTATAVPTRAVVEPALKDFAIDLIVLEKQCFGSAGCLVTVRPHLSTFIDGPVTPPSKTYVLVFEVAGVTGGVETYHIEIKGDQYSTRDLVLQTPRDNTVLVVTLVRLLPG